MHDSDDAFDRQVRLAVYRHLLETGVAPDPTSVAAAVGAEPPMVRAAFARLAAAHVLVLQPADDAVWMAMPFSAVPTRFRVRTDRGTWWANCAWDALGISAMLASAATVETACGDCDAPLLVETTGRAAGRAAVPGAEGAVVHFAVPARHWWEDIGFT